MNAMTKHSMAVISDAMIAEWLKNRERYEEFKDQDCNAERFLDANDAIRVAHQNLFPSSSFLNDVAIYKICQELNAELKEEAENA